MGNMLARLQGENGYMARTFWYLPCACKRALTIDGSIELAGSLALAHAPQWMGRVGETPRGSSADLVLEELVYGELPTAFDPRKLFHYCRR